MEEKLSIQRLATIKVPQCAFCFNQSQEIKSLLKMAFVRIKKLLKQKKYSQMACKQASSSTNFTALHRLIRVLFQKQQFQIKFSKNCSHFQLRNRYMQKLECRSDQFQCVLQDLCDKLARRNYQLQVISLQIKHVQNSVIQLQDSLQISTKTRKESLSSQSQPLKIPIFPPPVKIQPYQQPEIPCKPLQKTSTVYQPAYDSMGCSYNVIFYGAPYYQ